MKKVLIINGHPDKESFCFGLHQSYKKGSLEAGNEIKEIILPDMEFNPILQHGYRKRTELEPDLLDAWQKLQWAEHIVWIYPTWWAAPPALMKGFIERLFLPGFTFEYQETSPFPKKLLKGKTSEIISTMDSPVWYYKWIVKDVGGKMIRKNIGAFCGIKNIRTTYLAVIKQSTPEKRKQWLDKVEDIAKKTK
ncbi:NAD(P)H-dependent oxidoreductase [Dysgonomonas sp. Marseille-P4361]|uniref:NAD(P)H-dependent oxidoreductase n=1 Tax=Dysgonomonas sp. Marseille-P4361 TaxID=2161820 RepID=UPI000D5582BC|nr:NAD(P)H-dependent oxidoreductase [Dysgonomonas sp. Marseille-P4361]